jgi:hypothetical protein
LDKIEKQNQELSRRVEELAGRAPDLALQGKCAEQAKVVYGDENHPASDHAWYECHYNPKLNRCFYKVSSLSVENGFPIRTTYLLDAFELKEYGSYIWSNPSGKKFSEVSPSQCTVKSVSGEDVHCGSEAEFEHLISQYID